MIDTQAAIFQERGLSKIVPPSVFFRLVVKLAKDIDKPPLFQLADRLAFGLGKMHAVFPIIYIPHIHFMRSDVNVSAQQNLVVVGEILIKKAFAAA